LQTRALVGALSLDVAWLLALVAGSLGRGLGWTVSGQMTNLATVVAFLALGTITGHVSVTTARVASLSTVVATVTTTTAVSTISIATVVITTSLWAVTGNVSNFRALVALLGRAATRKTTTAGSSISSWVLAVPRDVTGLTALVASLVLGTLRALTAHVTLVTAVVALGRATGWAVTGLMGGVIAVVAAANCTATLLV